MPLLKRYDSKKIVEAIQEAEKNTSGEIRVHIQNRAGKDIIAAAEKKFVELGMTQTELRNGVLIFVAIKDRKFAIIGDAGINAKVPENFWNETAEEMLRLFRQNKITEAVVKGIHSAGLKLKDFFPADNSDINELTDEVSVDEKN
jgi:uncharacterized membrane protein